MNYITYLLNRKITFLQSSNKKNELEPHYQAKFEFYLLLTLGYIWNKNIEKIDEILKEQVLNSILRPSVGNIIEAIRIVDIDKEFFGNKKLKKLSELLNSYPQIRNELIGHGYSFEDNINNYIDIFDKLFSAFDDNDTIVSKDFDIIKVDVMINNTFTGISFKPDGNYIAWQCPKQTFDFKLGHIYLYEKTINQYYNISPFVYIEDENSIYLYRSVEERLTGRARYNKLISTGSKVFESTEFQYITIANDGVKIKHPNGTIINVFEKNYSKYIDVGIVPDVIKFLTKNKSSVYATLWGHGGVGKTASIQHICDYLCQQQSRIFDYIVFLSAKDRYYNYYKGEINPIDDKITSLNEIFLYINKVLFGKESFDKNDILTYEGSLLIIIDDFETFSTEEKKLISDFINELNINHHKVILTTRSAMLISGVEIQSNELTIEKTADFLKSVLLNEFPTYNLSLIEKDLSSIYFKQKLHKITSGRPLFILQFATLLVQNGGVNDLINYDIKSTPNAKNFLYDRIVDYLSLDAKNMFLAIGLLADNNDHSGLLDNLRYILNLEDKEEKFQSSLNELVKLKIINVEDKFFKVYSPEIHDLMKEYYQKKTTDYDGNITSRFNSIAERKDLDTELALLEAANASRLVSNNVEVENKYRYIINRKKTSKETKLKAILNFASYLSLNGQNDKTVKLFDDYYPIFRNNYAFINNYSKYCWANNDNDIKKKSITIIKDYFITRPRISQEEYLELLSLSVTNQTILAINEKDELKELREWESISDYEYKERSKVIKDTFKAIFNNTGKKLYDTCIDVDLMALSPSCRHYVLNGLNHYVDLVIRLNRWQRGIDVCNKIINNVPENYQKPYISKKNKIMAIIYSEETGNNNATKYETDLAIKLKEALNN